MMSVNNIFKGKYEIKLYCDNCNHTSIVRIPRGTKIKDHLSDYKARCNFCGCIILEGGYKTHEKSTS